MEIGVILNAIDAKVTANSEAIKSLSTSLVDLHAKMDLLLQNCKLQPSHDNQTVNPEIVAAPKLLNFKPIATIEDANQFERDLLNREFEMPLRKQLVLAHGTDIGPYGKTRVAHDLRVKLFDLKFFTLCSWSGSSIKGRSGLYAFSDFENIYNFFWSIVNIADKTFVEDDAKHFFQNIMNRKRSLNIGDDSGGPKKKIIRPHSKIRPKIGKYKKRQTAIVSANDDEQLNETDQQTEDDQINGDPHVSDQHTPVENINGDSTPESELMNSSVQFSPLNRSVVYDGLLNPQPKQI